MFEGNVGGNRYGVYSVLLLLKLSIGAWTYLASCQQVGLCRDLSVARIYAKDRDGQDVMLKVISYKDEGAGEVEILNYLLSAHVKSDIDNPVVPLLEILHHQDWKFSVQSRWSDCTVPEFRTVEEGLDFCAQVTKVSPSSFIKYILQPLTCSKGVAFLHRHLIAHLVCHKYISYLLSLNSYSRD